MKLPFADCLEEEQVKTKMSCSSRAGLASPVSHKDRQQCKGRRAACAGAGPPVCLVPVLQYSTYETADKDEEISEQHISPLHIVWTVKRYSELTKLLAGITIGKAGAHQRKKSIASSLENRDTKLPWFNPAAGN